ncbi:RNA recognition motif-containing protein [Besnoitia besnoiti]|uniref:RNA recognition motif-containing protein n=1 Tax=Besnoitia besnoiti TaxID=94643 RepID=A0A2A9MGC9_BESBE|nr:RNA recognition motif-containing protein [Besnoitia besnoiti]PFH34460.1 RNA recognition motif-containing protein [Besnoitia besnoiti]
MFGASLWPSPPTPAFGVKKKGIVPFAVHESTFCFREGGPANMAALCGRGSEERPEASALHAEVTAGGSGKRAERETGSSRIGDCQPLGALRGNHDLGRSGQSGNMRQTTLTSVGDMPRSSPIEAVGRETGSACPSSNTLFASSSPFMAPSVASAFSDALASCEGTAGPTGANDDGSLPLSQETAIPVGGETLGAPLAFSTASRTIDYFSLSSASCGTSLSAAGTPTSNHFSDPVRSRQNPALTAAEPAGCAELGRTTSASALAPPPNCVMPSSGHTAGHLASLMEDASPLQYQAPHTAHCQPESFQRYGQGASGLAVGNPGMTQKEAGFPCTDLYDTYALPAMQRVAENVSEPSRVAAPAGDSTQVSTLPGVSSASASRQLTTHVWGSTSSVTRELLSFVTTVLQRSSLPIPFRWSHQAEQYVFGYLMRRILCYAQAA